MPPSSSACDGDLPHPPLCLVRFGFLLSPRPAHPWPLCRLGRPVSGSKPPRPQRRQWREDHRPPKPSPSELFLRMWMCRPSSRVRRCGSLSVTPLPSWLRLCRFAATQRAAPASMLLPRLLPKRTPEARAEAPPPPHAAGVLPLVEDQRIYIVSLQIYCLLN